MAKSSAKKPPAPKPRKKSLVAARQAIQATQRRRKAVAAEKAPAPRPTPTVAQRTQPPEVLRNFRSLPFEEQARQIFDVFPPERMGLVIGVKPGPSVFDIRPLIPATKR